MYYARLRSSWEELSHYNSFIEWPASAPSENVPIPPTAAKIYVKIVEKTRVFQFLAGLKPDFEYARVHLLDMTPFPTLEEVYTRRHPGYQPPTPDCQTSSVAPGLPPAIDSPLSGIGHFPIASIPVTTNDDSPVSHSDDDRPNAIRKEKRGWGAIARKPGGYAVISAAGSFNSNSITVLELKAVEMGLIMIILYKMRRACIVTDSITVFGFLTCRTTPTWDTKHLVYRIMHLVTMLDDCMVMFNYMEINGATDNLAGMHPGVFYVEILSNAFAPQRYNS
ncbi:hypothetical protein GIB67_027474 [Kingdonia uniflora]|uniref:RNase H type-1 domain-containing protein n=1 Tax=Kingdonia uniflora TaxID=39325 RepID=A0A7J7MFH6_9MAGN|nr:hypothetical protein GIB67_027474 [Kingdonia uniflora]